MNVVSIDTLIAALKNPIQATVRPAVDGEKPDFVQEFDKLATGMVWSDGERGFCCDFKPPVMLRSSVGYVIKKLEQLP